MCEEAKRFIIDYLNALEHYDRIHLMFLAAYRREDSEALDGYRSLLEEARLNAQCSRERITRHQNAHFCAEATRFWDEFEE